MPENVQLRHLSDSQSKQEEAHGGVLHAFAWLKEIRDTTSQSCWCPLIFQSNKSVKGNHSWSHTTTNWCFQGELCTQETFLGLHFSATQTAVLFSHRLTSSPVSASHSGKTRHAVALQGRSRCHWLPIPTKWALGWAHKHWWDQPQPALHIKGYQQPCSLPWTGFEHITLH